MPELPEVETTRRGIEPHVLGVRVTEVIVRRRDLRQPVSNILSAIEGRRVTGVRPAREVSAAGNRRRQHAADPSRHVRQPAGGLPAASVEDARPCRHHAGERQATAVSRSAALRVGAASHRRSAGASVVGKPRPGAAGGDFTAAHLQAACAKRSAAIKLVIMDAKVVVGVGNIYASEALFRAGIRPQTAANRVSKPRLAKLVAAIRAVLTDSIAAGGTTLRDFLHSDGEPGYFKQQLFVYDRKGEPCRVCGTPIRHAVIGQRATLLVPEVPAVSVRPAPAIRSSRWPPRAVTHLPFLITLVKPRPLAAAAVKTSHAWLARMPETIRSPPGASALAITGQASISTVENRLAMTTS